MMIQRDTFEGAFFRAVLHIHTNNFVRAQSACFVFACFSCKTDVNCFFFSALTMLGICWIRN